MEFYTDQYFFVTRQQHASELSWTKEKPVKRGWYLFNLTIKFVGELRGLGFVSRNILHCYHYRNGFDNILAIDKIAGAQWSRCSPQPEFNHSWFCELPTRAKNVLRDSGLPVNRKRLRELNEDGELRDAILLTKNGGVATYRHISEVISRQSK